MIKNIAIVAAIVIVVPVAAVLALAATKPDSFRVQRATSIEAEPEKIFALINDLRGWGAWSPYEKKDPAMKRSFSGAPSGIGAVYEWDGDKNVGKDRLEIVEVSPPAEVTIKLDFERPFEAHNIVEFILQNDGGATKVTWAMQGSLPYMAKVAHVFFDMDGMVGTDFETGLASLKAAAER